MPILPPISTVAVLDSVTTILNSIRVRLNDALPSLYPTGGKVLDNTSAFTQQCFNNGYRKLQEYLSNLGYTPLIQEIIITNLPVVESQDPASQVYINWNNYFDGANYNSTPVLPDDLIQPLKVWERWSDQNMPFPDVPMECYLDGLPTNQKTTYNGCWEWRNNSIYMPGSQREMDLRIRYVKYLPDIVDIGSVRWYQGNVAIPRCLEALSLFVCAEFASSRMPDNDAEAAMQTGAVKSFSERAEGAAKLMFNRDVKMKERVTVSRIPRSGRGGGNVGYYGGSY